MSKFRYDFSVIVPTRDRPRQLVACLESFAAMDFPRDRFEVVVVDDGSAQPLDSVAEPFCKRLRLTLLRQEQSGPSTARNLGSAHATGEFLAFTDDDCRPDRAWLSALQTCLARFPDHLIGGKVINALAANIYSVTCHVILDAAYEYFEPARGRAHFFASSNLAVSAEKFRALNGFAENWALAAAEDRAFCFRWLQRGWAMTYADEAIIRHHHAHDLRSFWNLHFRYGRGAYYYQEARGKNGRAGRLLPAWGFYRLCFRRAFAGGNLRRALVIVCLLFIWQAANAGGYFTQRLARIRSAESRRTAKDRMGGAEK